MNIVDKDISFIKNQYGNLSDSSIIKYLIKFINVDWKGCDLQEKFGGVVAIPTIYSRESKFRLQLKTYSFNYEKFQFIAQFSLIVDKDSAFAQVSELLPECMLEALYQFDDVTKLKERYFSDIFTENQSKCFFPKAIVFSLKDYEDTKTIKSYTASLLYEH